MDSVELYRQRLGVTAPWTVQLVDMDVHELQVDGKRSIDCVLPPEPLARYTVALDQRGDEGEEARAMARSFGSGTGRRHTACGIRAPARAQGAQPV